MSLTLCQLSQDISSYHCKSFFEENRNECFLLNLNFFNIVCQVKKKHTYMKSRLFTLKSFMSKLIFLLGAALSRGSSSLFVCLFVDFLLIFSRFFCTQLFRSSSSLDMALTFIYPYVHFYPGLDKIMRSIQFFKFFFFKSFLAVLSFPH